MEDNQIKSLNFPEIYEIVGDFGRWQKRICFIFFYCLVISVWQIFNIIFLAPNIEFSCIVPFPSLNDSDLENGSIVAQNYTVSLDQCIIFLNYNESVSCKNWDFNHTYHERTIISDWNLVCDQKWLISFAKSIFMIGQIVSLLLMGQLSDWFGRRLIIKVSYLILLISSLLLCVSSSYIMFIILRFLSGFGAYGVITAAFTLLMEITGPKKRLHVSIGWQLSISIGFITLPGIAYLMKNWVYLQLILGLPQVLLIFMNRFVPESPRWLMVQQKWDKFEKLILEAAKENDLKTNNTCRHQMEVYRNFHKNVTIIRKKSILYAFRVPNLRYKILILLSIWFTTILLHYSLTFNTNDLVGNPYLNFFFIGLMQLIGCYIFFFIIRKYGRRKVFCVGTVVGGIFYFLIILIPSDLVWLTLTLNMLVMLCISNTTQVLYLYTTELFPTVIRNAALAYCTAFSRLGSSLSPFVQDFGAATNKYVPNILISVLVIINGLLILRLPDTESKRMLDTIEME